MIIVHVRTRCRGVARGAGAEHMTSGAELKGAPNGQRKWRRSLKYLVTDKGVLQKVNLRKKIKIKNKKGYKISEGRQFECLPRAPEIIATPLTRCQPACTSY